MAEDKFKDLSDIERAVIGAIERKIRFPADIASYITTNSDGDIEIVAPDVYKLLVDLTRKGFVKSYLNEREKRVWILADDTKETPQPPERPDPVERDHARSVHTTPDGAPGFDKLTEKEIDQKILEAIDEKYCTYNGIKKHIGAPRAYDVSAHLDGMAVCYVIRKELVGDLVVFFRYETMPVKPMLAGDGKVECEKLERVRFTVEEAAARELAGFEVPKDVAPAAPAVPTRTIDPRVLERLAATGKEHSEIADSLGVTPAQMSYEMANFEDLRDAYAEGRQAYGQSINVGSPAAPSMQPAVEPESLVEPDEDDEDPPELESSEEAAEEELDEAAPPLPATSRPEPATYSRKPIGVPDLARVEQLASEGKSMSKAAKELSLPLSTFAGYATGRGKEQRVKAAWDRGVALRNGGGPSKKAAAKPVAKKERSDKLEITVENLEALAFKHKGNQRKIAEALGFTGVNPGVSFRNRLKRSDDLRKAYERGSAKAQLDDPSVPESRQRPAVGRKPGPHAEPEPKTKALATTIVMEVEEEDIKPASELDGNGHRPESRVTVLPFAGGTIAIGINVDLLSASREERDSLNEFIDAAQALGTKRLNGGANGSDAI